MWKHRRSKHGCLPHTCSNQASRASLLLLLLHHLDLALGPHPQIWRQPVSQQKQQQQPAALCCHTWLITTTEAPAW
jgi:hypothetical protein